ncbi:MAG: hypothetical protein LBE31_09010 [Deltaproteobacteria bacterium]|jgi:hypothetical protein|nr:hypothetical protein [Deltaproteobacteria bacterium]
MPAKISPAKSARSVTKARVTKTRGPKAKGAQASFGLNKKQQSLLADYERLAKMTGLKVSAGRLVFAGLRLKGGRCSLRSQNWLVIDRFQTFEEQLDCFRAALAGQTITEELLEEFSEEFQKSFRQSASLLSGQSNQSAENH